VKHKERAMRSVREIQQEIEQLVEERDQYDFGSLTWDEIGVDLFALDCELREALNAPIGGE
jgi:hypothetical protein